MKTNKHEISRSSNLNSYNEFIIKGRTRLFSDKDDINDDNITNDLLDRIYDSAFTKATENFSDVELARFSITVFPFKNKDKVVILFHFWSRWSKTLTKYRYDDIEMKVIHESPDKHIPAISAIGLLKDLPWRISPNWKRFIRNAYLRIGPLSPNKDSNYSLTAEYGRFLWSLKFEDCVTGKEFKFFWTGQKLDDDDIITVE